MSRQKVFVIRDHGTMGLAIDMIGQCYKDWITSTRKNKVPWECVIRKHNKNRSLEQNDRYWALLRLVQEETGNDVDEMHRMMKVKFLGGEIVEFHGMQVAKDVPESHTLSKEEFNTFTTKVEAFFAQLGIALEDRP